MEIARKEKLMLIEKVFLLKSLDIFFRHSRECASRSGSIIRRT